MHFLFVGNAPYTNRGCEAIVRGTMEILGREFGEDFAVTMASFGPQALITKQSLAERDPRITHIPLRIERWSFPWILKHVNRRLKTRFPAEHWMLTKPLKTAQAALEIGGDNYSLDYGFPEAFIEMDRYIQRFRVPLVLWCASLGRSESDPQLSDKVDEHLGTLTGVFARESVTLDYLKESSFAGNVHFVADPAFAMKAVPPVNGTLGFTLPEGAIGINLSPLLARYTTGGDMNEWVRRCAEIIEELSLSTDRDIVLIPHVTSSHSNDHEFLELVAGHISGRARTGVHLVGDNLSAEETKWVISNCRVFMGARTHSTIAALSSLVPTLTLAYSWKARGITRDIFGTENYCLEPNDITPIRVLNSLKNLLANRDSISEVLHQKIPKIIDRAFEAGRLLRRIIEKHNADRGGGNEK